MVLNAIYMEVIVLGVKTCKVLGQSAKDMKKRRWRIMYEYKNKVGTIIRSDMSLNKGDVVLINNIYYYIESKSRDNILELEQYAMPTATVEYST
jgi:hypothetical protein